MTETNTSLDEKAGERVLEELLNMQEARVLTSAECVELGELYIFLYALFITLLLFTVGQQYVSDSSQAEDDRSSKGFIDTEARDQSAEVNTQDSSAGSAATDTEIALEDDKAQRQSQGAEQQVSQGGHGNGTSKSVADGEHKEEESNLGQQQKQDVLDSEGQNTSKLCLLLKAASSPPTIAQFAGILVGLVPPLQAVLFGNDAPLGAVTAGIQVLANGTVSVLNIIMACTLALKIKSLKNKSDLFGNLDRVEIGRAHV